MTERPVSTETPPRRMPRVPEGRIIAGVCSGLGRYTGIDPLVYRAGFAVLTLAQGQGIVLYIGAVLLMPSEPGVAAPIEQPLKRRFDGAAVLSLLGLALALSVAAGLIGGVSSDALTVLTVFGLVLLVAHARGVDLREQVRLLPERLQGRPPQDVPRDTRPVALDELAADGLGEGMVDLAAYSASARAAAPPDVTAYGATDAMSEPPVARAKNQKTSPLTWITLLLACAVGALVLPAAREHGAPRAVLMAGGAALLVIGAGLVIGGFVRVRGLATAGTLLTFALLAGGVVSELPEGSRYGDVVWRPTGAVSAPQDYRLGIGVGNLDLTDLAVAGGQRVAIDAQVTFGELKVRIPAGARVVLDARVRMGDLVVGSRTIGGPNARVTEVWEPEGQVADPPVIELRVRGRLGDVEVSRA
ncbi:PspC domain-containing protein [Actinomadura parmotrematis]|uniref:PspC domain-containing protein n=1 Tax=Actinomadura parmotrematis TaxID=2864039 RepID=A0ABS7G5Q1_9ACTN|nr:PspC domain-containing protein [Actinomadura parmotrematis]MBW8486968.1 PspC domain-containing protein [Actinomadura parmotrematis]